MPSMLRTNSYDTICHEHLEYYSLNNILYILEKVNMKIVDIQFNSINGGSFAITAAKNNCNVNRSNSITRWLLKQESRMGLDTPAPFRRFEEESIALRIKLQKIPLNALAVRKRNRCALTGRPRGVYRKFTLGRTKLREMAMQGLIPGLTKASW